MMNSVNGLKKDGDSTQSNENRPITWAYGHGLPQQAPGQYPQLGWVSYAGAGQIPYPAMTGMYPPMVPMGVPYGNIPQMQPMGVPRFDISNLTSSGAQAHMLGNEASVGGSNVEGISADGENRQFTESPVREILTAAEDEPRTLIDDEEEKFSFNSLEIGFDTFQSGKDTGLEVKEEVSIDFEEVRPPSEAHAETSRKNEQQRMKHTEEGLEIDFEEVRAPSKVLTDPSKEDEQPRIEHTEEDVEIEFKEGDLHSGKIPEAKGEELPKIDLVPNDDEMGEFVSGGDQDDVETSEDLFENAERQGAGDSDQIESQGKSAPAVKQVDWSSEVDNIRELFKKADEEELQKQEKIELEEVIEQEIAKDEEDSKAIDEFFSKHIHEKDEFVSTDSEATISEGSPDMLGGVAFEEIEDEMGLEWAEGSSSIETIAFQRDDSDVVDFLSQPILSTSEEAQVIPKDSDFDENGVEFDAFGDFNGDVDSIGKEVVTEDAPVNETVTFEKDDGFRSTSSLSKGAQNEEENEEEDDDDWGEFVEETGDIDFISSDVEISTKIDKFQSEEIGNATVTIQNDDFEGVIHKIVEVVSHIVSTVVEEENMNVSAITPAEEQNPTHESIEEESIEGEHIDDDDPDFINWSGETFGGIGTEGMTDHSEDGKRWKDSTIDLFDPFSGSGGVEKSEEKSHQKDLFAIDLSLAVADETMEKQSESPQQTDSSIDGKNVSDDVTSETSEIEENEKVEAVVSVPGAEGDDFFDDFVEAPMHNNGNTDFESFEEKESLAIVRNDSTITDTDDSSETWVIADSHADDASWAEFDEKEAAEDLPEEEEEEKSVGLETNGSSRILQGNMNTHDNNEEELPEIEEKDVEFAVDTEPSVQEYQEESDSEVEHVTEVVAMSELNYSTERPEYVQNEISVVSNWIELLKGAQEEYSKAKDILMRFSEFSRIRATWEALSGGRNYGIGLCKIHLVSSRIRMSFGELQSDNDELRDLLQREMNSWSTISSLLESFGVLNREDLNLAQEPRNVDDMSISNAVGRCQVCGQPVRNHKNEKEGHFECLRYAELHSGCSS